VINDYKKLFNDETVWHKKIAIVAACHYQHCALDKKWTLSKTAKLLELSVGTISENCRIAELIELNPKLIERCENRKEALKYIYR
jgi:hypothetical protein